MTALLLLLPILFTTLMFLDAQRNRFRAMIALGSIQFLLACGLYIYGSDPLPLLAPHFGLAPLSLGFLLAHTGIQLVAFLSLPRVQRTQHQLLGALFLSTSCIATITAQSDEAFLFSFLVSLFAPLFLALFEPGVESSRRIFLGLALLCGGLILTEIALNSTGMALTLSLPLLFAASIRLGFVPFHLWVRRMILGFPLQWSVLYFLSYPSIALFLRARLGDYDAPIQEAFLQLASITVIYGAWLAIVQKELRTTFYYLVLSFLGAIGVGLAMASSKQALSGVLLFWFSGSLAVAGFGMTIEILESRFGRLHINHSRGLIRCSGSLASVFLLLGLASVGFPGLCAFIGEEVMLSGIYAKSAWAAIPILAAFSLNGITVVRWFFAVFFGPNPEPAEGVDLLRRERFAFMLLLAIIIGTGLFPRPLFELGKSAAAQLSSVSVESEQHP